MSQGMDYWAQKSKGYPFHAQEDMNGPRVPFTGRAAAKSLEAIYGNFLRCPAPEIGAVLWGFEAEASLLRFLRDHKLPDMRGRGGPA